MRLWITLLLWPALLLARGATLEYNLVGVDSITVGDPFQLWMDASAGEGGELNWPAVEKLRLGSCGLLADTLVAIEGGGERRILTLAAYEIGTVTLPPQGVTWTRGGDSGELVSDSLRLEVLSVLPRGVPLENAGEPQQAPLPRDIVPPLNVHHGPLWFVIRAIVLLAVLLLCWLGWRWWTRPRALAGVRVEPEPQRDPWEIFSAAMTRIRFEELWRSGDVVEYWAQLSLAVRGLLEDSMRRPAREMTTYEIEELLDHAPFGEADRRRLLELLRENDLVKYARQWPTDERNRHLADDYARWAESVKPGLMALYHSRELAEQERDTADDETRAESQPGEVRP